jgi:single-strand DNA-binding protein
MSCVNKVILVGNLGADPALRVTSAGRNLATFSVATSRNWQDDKGEWQQQTNWHGVVVGGDRAQTVSDRMAKGHRVYVEGRLQSRSWEDERGQRRYLTEVHARRVFQLSPPLSGDPGGDEVAAPGNGAPPDNGAPPGNGAPPDNGNQPDGGGEAMNDIPF